MLLIDGRGLPLGIDLHSASPSEVRLFEPLLDNHVLGQHAPRLIYDRTADSDPLRDRLAKDGIQLICPHRKCRRKRHPSQDGRVLKRYRQRWKVEPTIAWLGNYQQTADPLRTLSSALHRLRPTRQPPPLFTPPHTLMKWLLRTNDSFSRTHQHLP